ncbi:MAG TPA: flagellar basal body-associated FliL family protein [Smithellaceae bacterium]|nr:flagellar basal body-associated FliL family protein [Smithellaceae bacterium]
MAAAAKKVENTDDLDEKDGEEQAPVKKKGSPLVLIIVVVVLLLVVAGGGAAAYFLFLKPKPAATEQAKATPKPQVSVFYPMEPFIVNLIDNEGERYLKVVMQLELSDPKVLEEFRMLNPKLRDTVLDLLSAKTYREMMDPLGKQRLREEIAVRINMIASQGKVTKVYFTEFVIQ